MSDKNNNDNRYVRNLNFLFRCQKRKKFNFNCLTIEVFDKDLLGSGNFLKSLKSFNIILNMI